MCVIYIYSYRNLKINRRDGFIAGDIHDLQFLVHIIVGYWNKANGRSASCMNNVNCRYYNDLAWVDTTIAWVTIQIVPFCCTGTGITLTTNTSRAMELATCQPTIIDMYAEVIYSLAEIKIIRTLPEIILL